MTHFLAGGPALSAPGAAWAPAGRGAPGAKSARLCAADSELRARITLLPLPVGALCLDALGLK